MERNDQNIIAGLGGKNIFRFIVMLSLLLLAAIIGLSQLPKAEHVPGYVKWLPRLNAFLNGTCSLLLIASFYFIKQKNIAMHKRLNITAFVLSSLFLVSYVWFHSFGIETKFPVDNPLRPFYLFILLTHIVLAAGVLPLVLITFYFGLMMKVKQHRKIARWTFPVWLYVTVTGVIVYLMISPYYKF